MARIYSEGNIRIRGKRENIIRFLQHELVAVYKLEGDKDEERPIRLEENCGGWTVILTRDPDTESLLYFKGSRDYWIETNHTETEILFTSKHDFRKDEIVCLENYEGPFKPNYEFWRKKAMEYKIDIRIFSWDDKKWSSATTWYRNGMGDTTLQTYEDFFWNCPIPGYGEGYY